MRTVRQCNGNAPPSRARMAHISDEQIDDLVFYLRTLPRRRGATRTRRR